ncbi:facilitated trehalose transporter Tret1 [Manduca sexta]|uniref:Major facilitator superfamily (MFS) profile domain-containing protein n=2 Tax=Manduca sexta TaxID=7130 RepID=A0A921YUM5_MANSE|nr:facilitated trehalose transporter Tret1 [Manduca sexta]KAG6445904.1 hypothetical protein O3G_MSEX004128 [Manduca sexta]
MEKSRQVQYLVTLCVSLAFVCLGMLSAWPTPVLSKFHDNETSVDITDNGISWMLSMKPIGFILGSFATRFTSDNLGRRATILGSAIPIAIGMLIVAFAKNAWLLGIMTLLWSFGTGMLSTVIGIYLAEIADTEIRGTLSLCTRFTFHLGNLLIMCIGPFVSYETINYLMLPLPFVYFAACWWIPESPYFHLKEGKVDAARRQLVKLKCCKDEKELDNLLSSKQADVNKEMERSSSTKELFTGRQYRKALIISAGLKATQILTGSVTIKEYLGPICRESNIPKYHERTVLLVFGAVTFVVGIMSTMLVDRVGRRPLLIYSYFVTGLSLVVVGAYFFLQDVIRVNHDFLAIFGFIPFLAILIANIVSTIGFNSLVSVIPAEIFPLNVKAVAMTSLNVFGGVLGFLVAKCYQNVKDLVGLTAVFWIFGTVGIVGGFFTYFVVPETKGKNLREIQLMLEGDYTAVKLNQDAVNCQVNEEVPLEEVNMNIEVKK